MWSIFQASMSLILNMYHLGSSLFPLSTLAFVSVMVAIFYFMPDTLHMVCEYQLDSFCWHSLHVSFLGEPHIVIAIWMKMGLGEFGVLHMILIPWVTKPTIIVPC